MWIQVRVKLNMWFSVFSKFKCSRLVSYILLDGLNLPYVSKHLGNILDSQIKNNKKYMY